MKEFIDKLIGRLEEAKVSANRRNAFDSEVSYACAIDIVTKLAEEYKDKVMIDGQYCWQTCSATEHCKECRRLGNGDIDYYENYDYMTEEYKGGWISCKVELPKKTGKYLACDSQGNIFITKYYEGCNGFNGNVGFVIKAWCELPAPYTEGE